MSAVGNLVEALESILRAHLERPSPRTPRLSIGEHLATSQLVHAELIKMFGQRPPSVLFIEYAPLTRELCLRAICGICRSEREQRVVEEMLEEAAHPAHVIIAAVGSLICNCWALPPKPDTEGRLTGSVMYVFADGRRRWMPARGDERDIAKVFDPPPRRRARFDEMTDWDGLHAPVRILVPHVIAYPPGWQGPLESTWTFDTIGDGYIRPLRTVRLMTVYVEGDGGGWMDRWRDGAPV